MLDMTPTGIEIAVLGALGGVVTYFLNQFLVERYRAAVRTRRLREGLLVDCVEILHRVNNLPFQFHRTPGATDRDDLRQVMKHPNGFVICGPLSETRELVTLLDRRGSRLVVRFFERWAMFSILEGRYTAIYQKLLDTAAQCTDVNDPRNSIRELKEEYWEQLRSSLAAMESAGKDLCFFACQLFRHLGKFDERLLAQYSAQRWKTWREFETELARYTGSASEVEAKVDAADVTPTLDALPSISAVPRPAFVVRRRAIERNDLSF
jgi:hypothetical protein